MSRPGAGDARLARLLLRDVRCFADACLEPDVEGTTVLTGPNGSGKTTFLEGVYYLGTQRSFRTSARDSMVRGGCDGAVVRAELAREGRTLLVESELPRSGHVRTLVNRQVVRARRELARSVPVSVFSPEDLGIVQGAPLRRRDLLDGALRLVDAEAAAALDELERVLRQRSALLRRAGGRLGAIAGSLDVWDERLARVGGLVAGARGRLAGDLAPLAAEAYGGLAGVDATGGGSGEGPVAIAYRATWAGSLAVALAARREEDVRRAVTSVGPHRDDLEMRLGGRDARVEASQGEQRSLALALRLAVHELVTARTGAAPLLLLDDVFSELDPDRSRSLVRHLPEGQALLTTASPLPGGVRVAKVVDVTTAGRRG